VPIRFIGSAAPKERDSLERLLPFANEFAEALCAVGIDDAALNVGFVSKENLASIIEGESSGEYVVVLNIIEGRQVSCVMRSGDSIPTWMVRDLLNRG
jgi:hypothetical protein